MNNKVNKNNSIIKFPGNWWEIKQGRKIHADRILYATMFAGVICGILAIWLTKEVMLGFAWWFGVYVFSAYILLGHFKCYKIRKFRGHIALRWCFLALMTALWICMIITGGVTADPWFLGLVYFGLLLCSIQSVRNGYS